MLDMYATANALSLMHLKGKTPKQSDSILLEKKTYKKKKGQEEYEAHLWSLLQKACSIRDVMQKKRTDKANLEAADQEDEYADDDYIQAQTEEAKDL